MASTGESVSAVLWSLFRSRSDGSHLLAAPRSMCSAYVACVTYDALGLATSAAQLIHECARTRLEGFVPYAQTPELLSSAGLEPSRVDVWTTCPSQGLRFHPL